MRPRGRLSPPTEARPSVRRAVRSLSSTSTRTFVLWPIVVAVDQALARRPVRWPYLTVAVAGHLLYRYGGSYRTRHGGGGPGMSNPPERLVTSGIYRWTRNPMYLGHLLSFAGLAAAARSPLSRGLLLVHLPWFDARVREDERHLAQRFGPEFDAYRRRAPRWFGLPRWRT